MDELKTAEIRANIAKLEAEERKLRTETESTRLSIVFNVIKLAISAFTVVTALIVAADKLIPS